MGDVASVIANIAINSIPVAGTNVGTIRNGINVGNAIHKDCYPSADQVAREAREYGGDNLDMQRTYINARYGFWDD